VLRVRRADAPDGLRAEGARRDGLLLPVRQVWAQNDEDHPPSQEVSARQSEWRMDDHDEVEHLRQEVRRLKRQIYFLEHEKEDLRRRSVRPDGSGNVWRFRFRLHGPMAAMFAQQFITLVDDLAGYRIGDALHVAIARPVDAPLLLHPAASTVGERVAE